jgi:branched-chain amino acid aminotransferase
MAKERLVWINGDLVPWENATVHILSHGFSRGSALFEVFGIHEINNRAMAFRMDRHMERLRNSCDLLGMPLAQSTEELVRAVKDTVQANGLKAGFIKLVAYWGLEAFATLVPDQQLDVSIFAISMEADIGLDLSKPISACISKWAKLHPQTVPVAAKAAANYLNSMLARQDAQNRGYDMGVMLDTHGFLAEGSIESVFLVKDGILKTSPLGRVLASISRRSVIEAAQTIGVEVQETAISKYELFEAEEMFSSATPFKVLPVNRFENIHLTAPGPISLKLRQAMETILKGDDDRFSNWLIPLDD